MDNPDAVLGHDRPDWLPDNWRSMARFDPRRKTFVFNEFAPNNGGWRVIERSPGVWALLVTDAFWWVVGDGREFDTPQAAVAFAVLHGAVGDDAPVEVWGDK